MSSMLLEAIFNWLAEFWKVSAKNNDFRFLYKCWNILSSSLLMRLAVVLDISIYIDINFLYTASAQGDSIYLQVILNH